MKLLYPNTFMRFKQLDYEYYYFVTNYIVGEKIYMHSTIGYFIYVVKNINKFNSNQIVDVFENLNLKTHFHMEYQPTDFFREANMMRKNIIAATALKKVKHLPKQHLEYLQQLNKGVTMLKDSIIEELLRYLKLANIENYLELIDENVININYTTINKSFELNDNEIGEIIYNNFITKEKLVILENVLNIEKEKDIINELNETKINNEKGYDIAFTTIVEIPCPKDLSQSDLIILRSQYLTEFNNIFQKVQDYNIQNCKDEYSDITTKKFEIFGEKLVEDYKILQTEIENNIYFQKIRNSDKDYINIKIIIVLLPLSYILSIYNYMCVLSLGKVFELKNRVEKEIGPEACEICIFYDIDPIINE